MSIIQTFYDSLAASYDKLYEEWESATKEQALILERIFSDCGLDKGAEILDCACGIGTQAIGLASLGYRMTASDISGEALKEAGRRAHERGLHIRFEQADFRKLTNAFDTPFDAVIAMDNALPHMLTEDDLSRAVESIAKQTKLGGVFVGSIRDYDALLQEKPPYSPPYVYRTACGTRVAFQTWDWDGECYQLTQYIIEDENEVRVSKFECAYRATRREELTNLLCSHGFQSVIWNFPKETGFFQPIVIAKK